MGKLAILKSISGYTEIKTAQQWYKLGGDFFHGENGKRKDPKSAMVCYKQAIKLDPNHHLSIFNLGLLFEYQLVDFVKARKYYELEARVGCVLSKKRLLILNNPGLTTAQQWYELGESYYYVNSQKGQDYVLARICYEQALELNSKHRSSLYSMGWIYEHGRGGIAIDLEQAKIYYACAAAEDHYQAQVQLLILDNPTLTTAQQWYELAQDYNQGKREKKQDYVLARICYEQAIKLDPRHARSLSWLGSLYEYGEGVTKDTIKARTYYERGAKEGYLYAQKRLLILNNPGLTTPQQWFEFGETYRANTIGKTQDYFQAMLCYEQALNIDPEHLCSQEALSRTYGLEKYSLISSNKKKCKNKASAWYDLGEEYYYGINARKINFYKARICYEQAIVCDLKYAPALHSLGVQYHDGKGVIKDISKAKYYYERAAREGSYESQQQLFNLNNVDTNQYRFFQPRKGCLFNHLTMELLPLGFFQRNRHNVNAVTISVWNTKISCHSDVGHVVLKTNRYYISFRPVEGTSNLKKLGKAGVEGVFIAEVDELTPKKGQGQPPDHTYTLYSLNVDMINAACAKLMNQHEKQNTHWSVSGSSKISFEGEALNCAVVTASLLKIGRIEFLVNGAFPKIKIEMKPLEHAPRIIKLGPGGGGVEVGNFVGAVGARILGGSGLGILLTPEDVKEVVEQAQAEEQKLYGLESSVQCNNLHQQM